MTIARLRWIRWAWRIAGATYIAGAVTLLVGSSVIVFWTSLLFTPLLAWTLFRTRSKVLAVGIPVVGAALLSSAQLMNSLVPRQQVPQSMLFQGLWFVAVLGPLILYPVVSRYVKVELRRLVASDPR